MGQVIEGNFRPKKAMKFNPKANDIYFCTACKADDFTITLPGTVLCSGCGNRINNLKVTMERNPSAA